MSRQSVESHEKKLTEHNVFQFASQYLGKEQESLALDLSAVQPDRVAGSILAGVLLTRAAKAQLRLTLPAKDPLDALARSGLLFACAHREGDVDFLPTSLGVKRYYEEWRRPWMRGLRQPLLKLLELKDETSVEPSVFGPTYAAFVNPHQSTGVGDVSSGVAEVVRPWLYRLLPTLTTAPERTEAGGAFVQNLGRLIDELIENVAEHAASGRSKGIHSFVLVSLARGNNEAARHRLHVSVVDTGPGIIETARKKIEVAGKGVADERKLLRDLFEGNIKSLGRARGFGLPHVWETVRAWEGARLVATANGLLLRGEDADPSVTQVADILRGTIVSATFPLPPQARATANSA